MRAVKARGLDKVFKNRDRRHRVRTSPSNFT